MDQPRTVSTPVLDIAYETAGAGDGQVVVLLHGFPYDVRCYDGVVPVLADAGMRVVVPYLRGYGPTRYRSADVMRSGQQGALGQDLLDLLDALEIERAVVGGFDWGGRAACIAAAVAPERVAGLVTVGGYNIQDIAHSAEPATPEAESAAWYTHYFLTDRGRAGLEQYTDELCGLLWRQSSPTWANATTAFAVSAPSLHNPDFIETVIHSYRHRRGMAPGDPRYDRLEELLASAPKITVPTVALDALADGLGPDDSSPDEPLFTGGFDRRELPGIGHNPPQEAPESFARAILDVAP
ncbi:alpha/beta fold hydrolase [Kribbella sindirgiensis]|uniref:Alpha/beta hydrolase n=1 Tax=Kribbella sindirgiensis TaxID=1124744 RepID=A0A4R0I8A7_9ACTN|nr:alpha/beta hydrolase [Kribbella sindirgiensis]TCC28457.1 alpha/beta hydrolase [Kribbella sindirgiensis]